MIEKLKEIYFKEKNYITIIDKIEWIELVKAYTNILLGANKEKVIKNCLYINYILLKKRKIQHTNNQQSVSLYGDGTANKKTVEAMIEYE